MRILINNKSNKKNISRDLIKIMAFLFLKINFEGNIMKFGICLFFQAQESFFNKINKISHHLKKVTNFFYVMQKKISQQKKILFWKVDFCNSHAVCGF